MATDATGTPTSKGIPKFNTAVDKPSGVGSNAQMDAIDALFDSYAAKPSGIVSGEVPVWNGTTWVRSSVTRIGVGSLGSGSPSSSNFLRGDGTWASAGGAGYGTSLPGSPTDSEQYILVDSTTAATYQWLFRYNSARSSDKWEFIGGSPKVAVDADQSTRSSSSYGDLGDTADSPSITVPRAGVYNLSYGAQVETVSFGDVTVFVSFSNGATASSDSVGVFCIPKTVEEGGSQNAKPVTLMRTLLVTVASASDAITMEYRSSTGGSATFSRRWLELTPVRVS